ncbi:hypothetical protein XENORESO_005005 [Xenotaenia resolanae]|uniref:UBC core domain-containing protein n=1 Tax=Xenotaenia resolanae TaxID=208358 RepID=A0ABV0VUZ1_9TELE
MTDFFSCCVSMSRAAEELRRSFRIVYLPGKSGHAWIYFLLFWTFSFRFCELCSSRCFHVVCVFQVGQGYPHDPPKVKCETMVYHPNIDLEGNVCLNILRSVTSFGVLTKTRP